jgi:hypothetical protein
MSSAISFPNRQINDGLFRWDFNDEAGLVEVE